MVLTIRNTWLLGIVFFLTAFVGFAPLLSGSGRILVLISFLSLLVVVVNSSNENYTKNFPLVFNVVLYVILVFLYKSLGISDVTWGETISHVLFFIPILMMPFTSVFSYKQSKWLILLMLLVILVVILDNIRLCLQHPELLLEVNRGALTDEIEGIGNIGGSAFYNSVCFFFIVCYGGFLNVKRKALKYTMFIASVVSGLFVIVFCLKASVIVFVVLSAVLLVFAKKTKSLSRFICVGGLITVFAYLFIALFADTITEFLFSAAERRLASRLMVFVDSESAEAGSGISTMNARGQLWMISINTWLSNPINFLLGIGNHPHHDLSIQELQKSGIGHHSDLFDLFGKYGLLGAFLVFNILRMCYKYISSLFEKEKKLQILVIFVLLLLFGFTKGIFKHAIGCSLFLILPLMSNIIPRKDSCNNGLNV